ncbi:uncharacterized protein EAE98_006636 [Botrytis deweyae]|uniref:NACHT domain-containing protein n=1 Tax=Botrytis deweyae TaxID=2478750 RepID=A0ABQ7IJW2_9HELO|nr:uncharacterized protein EAE98_006636 [Botrytis deweyae]KAF7926341.1 hypothetical protein EAE98_006636 [Botrytis deweyae]
MLDPLSALSLAATIFQFVDFGSKVISTATELHHSSEGALANNLELSTIISDLSSISSDLSARSSAQGKHSYNKDELALIDLASQCKELSDKLLHDLDGLNNLNIKKAHTKWASARQAMRSLWKEAYISEISKRLDGFRNQLVLRLVALLADKHSAMSIALIGLQRSQDRTESNIMGYLSGLRDDLFTLSQDNRNHERTKAVLWNKLSHHIGNGNTLATARAVLEKFKYEGMGRRISNVVEAHNGTFDWIFDPQTTGFLQWLRDGSDIYWINGNAGSGKSTLMKYFVGNDIVKTALLDWAGTKPLFMGNYFFWYAGNELEKSQKAFYYLYFTTSWENVPRWASPHHSGINMDGSWSRNELLDALEKLTKKQLWPGRFASFIDGVDEYMGDPAEIARLLKAFATSADVKLIVSSRPWIEIETFIDPIPGQSLPLQYFTRADIQRYTCDLITNHPDFRIIKIDKCYWNLIEQISSKSSGVFLWVVLAVREILKGLTNQDTISELEARLEDIPPGLEEVFDRILNTIEKCYRHQTSQIIQMCLSSPTKGMWPVITFAFLDEEKNNPDYALLAKLNPWPVDHYNREQYITRKRVIARCRDFMDFTGCWTCSPLPHVFTMFLHRTVEEFFLRPAMQKLLLEWTKHPFNPHLSLCRSFIMHLKVFPPAAETTLHSAHPSNCDIHLTSIISSFLRHVKKQDLCYNTTLSALIEEVDQIVTCRSSSNDFKTLLMMGYQRRWKRGWILALCVRHRILEYARQKLQENSTLANNIDGCYPLHIALSRNTISSFNDPYDADDMVTMVKVPLEAGADPNQPSIMPFDPMRDTTLDPLSQMEKTLINGTWAAFIQLWFEEQIEFGIHVSGKIRTEIFRLLLNYGADLSVKIIVRQEERGVTKSLMHYSLSEYLEKALPDSAECYSLLLERIKENKSRNKRCEMPRWQTNLLRALGYISGAETEILDLILMNLVVICLELLQRYV